MPISRRLEETLKRSKVEYREFMHAEAYTAQEVAATLHVPGKELAKVVIVRAGERFVMAVLPAMAMVDFGKLKTALGERNVRLATEGEFKALFPDCEPGAEPPFGNLYDMETLIDKSLTADKRIYFNAGTHYEAVEIALADYISLVKPRVEDFAAMVGH